MTSNNEQAVHEGVRVTASKRVTQAEPKQNPETTEKHTSDIRHRSEHETLSELQNEVRVLALYEQECLRRRATVLHYLMELDHLDHVPQNVRAQADLLLGLRN